MPEYDVTVRITKKFYVKADDEYQAMSTARGLLVYGAERVTYDDLDNIDVEEVER